VSSRGRWRERGLLLLPIAVLLLGLAQLALERTGQVQVDQFASGLIFTATIAAIHAVLSWRLPHADQQVLPIAAMLASLGLVIITRLQPALALRQSVWLVVGLGLMGAIAWGLPSVAWLKRYRYTAAALGLSLVLATFVFGVDPNGSGARLWLSLAGLYVQPSEVLKVLLVLFFASYLDDYQELLVYGGTRLGPLRLAPLPYLAPLLLMVAVSLGILTWQRDLGAALLFFGVFLALLYAASGRLGLVGLGLLGFAAAAWLADRLFAIVRVRIAVWLDPWAQRQTAGYQIVQALFALAAGGVSGTGLGYGLPDRIPAAHTDFAIAAIGEELGLIGSLAVVALYAALVHRAFRIALATRDSFAALLATGLGAVVGLQALVILAGTLRLIPLTGITLPLMSYGGSSVVANCAIVGLLLRVSHEAGAVAAREAASRRASGVSERRRTRGHTPATTRAAGTTASLAPDGSAP